MQKAKFVYFVQAGENGPIKIGVAASPRKRVTELQTGNPVALAVRHQIFVCSANTAYRLERKLHFKLRKYRATGEWFMIQWYLPTILKANAFNYKQIFFNKRD